MSNLDSPINFNDLVDSINTLDSGKLDKEPDGLHNLIDANNKVSIGYLPDVVLHQMVYGGTFVPNTAVATLTTNAKSKLGTTSNTITLTNDSTAITGYTDNEGCFYVCSAAGSFAGIAFSSGDWLVSTGTAWDRVDTSDAVTSVEGRTGAVTVIDDTKGTGETTYTWSADKLNTLASSIVSDVQVNNSSIVTSGVAQIPLAEMNGGYGLVKLHTYDYGLSVVGNGLTVLGSTDAQITSKANTSRPLMPKNIDLLTKTGLTTNTLTLSDAEKVSANTWLGSLQGVKVNGTALTKDANNAVDVSVPTSVRQIASAGTGIEFNDRATISGSVVGTGVTVSSAGVASGFSTSSYISTASPIKAYTTDVSSTITSFEMGTKVNIASGAGSPGGYVLTQEITGGSSPFAAISIYPGNGVGRIQGILSGYSASNTSMTIARNTDYWIKYSWTAGNKVEIYFSTDGVTYTKQGESSSSMAGVSSGAITNLATNFYTGAKFFQSASAFGLGSVDLTQSYIKINGTEVWRGASTSTYVDTTALLNTATGTNALALLGTASSNQSVAIGYGSTATGIQSVDIGMKSSTPAGAVGDYSTSIGSESHARGNYSLAIGRTALADNYAVAIGYVAKANGDYSIQLGRGQNSVANTFSVGLSASNNYRLLNSDGTIPGDRVPSSVYDRTKAISSGSINIENGTVFYTDSPAAATTYTIDSSATSLSGFTYRYINVLINMPSTAVGIDFTTNNNIIWTENETPDMSVGGRTYLLAFQTFDSGTTWIGSLCTWWETPSA